MDNYELQVLDSFENKTYFDGQAGAIYKQMPPQVNATKAPGTWNVYDVIWKSPRFQADGSLKSPAAITALHNGVLILNHFELTGDTPFHRPPQYTKHADRLPIRLQDHGNPMRFRNIWIRETKTPEAKQGRKNDRIKTDRMRISDYGPMSREIKPIIEGKFGRISPNKRDPPLSLCPSPPPYAKIPFTTSPCTSVNRY